MFCSLLLSFVSFLSEDELRLTWNKRQKVKVCTPGSQASDDTEPKFLMRLYCDGVGVSACVILGPSLFQIF